LGAIFCRQNLAKSPKHGPEFGNIFQHLKNYSVDVRHLGRFFSTGISDTVPHRFLLQAGSNTTMLTWHHHHHFPTWSLEYLSLSLKLPTQLYTPYLFKPVPKLTRPTVRWQRTPDELLNGLYYVHSCHPNTVCTYPGMCKNTQNKNKQRKYITNQNIHICVWV
jgi:hypothetical protein